MSSLSGCGLLRYGLNLRGNQSEAESVDTSDALSEDTSTDETSEPDVSEEPSDPVPTDYINTLYGEKTERYEGVFDIGVIAEGYKYVYQMGFLNESEVIFVFFKDEGKAVYIYNIFDGSSRLLLEVGAELYDFEIYEDGSAICYTGEDNEPILFFIPICLRATRLLYSRV
ncbi:MAG: hypothetical protein CVU97_05300 [Firmicutes bacterium HGW-Firmicutes-21]|nr:MAG: hypothetical protein CVU97_05300 [Firmicutes bacterium HGW-Firmicutes-21]